MGCKKNARHVRTPIAGKDVLGLDRLPLLPHCLRDIGDLHDAVWFYYA